MPHTDTDHKRRRGLLALTALCALGVLILYLLMVRTTTGQELDASAYEGSAIGSGLGAQHAERLLEAITVGSLVMATIALTIVAVARRRIWLAIVPVAVIAGSLLVTEVLKLVILQREDLLGTGEVVNSYPSGHTTIAISLGVAAMLVVPAWMRPATVIGAIAYASLIGVATVAAGWHRPSDVAGAYLVTVGVAAFVIAAIGAAATASESGQRTRAPAAIALGVVLGMLGLFAIAIAENVAAIDWTAVDRGFLAFAFALPALAASLISALAYAAWAPLAGARLGDRARA